MFDELSIEALPSRREKLKQAAKDFAP